MKEGEFLENLPPEEKKRLAYIEGREDLFHTKILEIETDDVGQKTDEVVIVSRDPGSANALAPVVELLRKENGVGLKLITDGRAQEIFQKKFKTKYITPEDNILVAAGTIINPSVGLVDASEEVGTDMFFAATFPEVPTVMVADYYTGSCLGYLKRLKEAKLPFPKKICVIDKEAKKIMVEMFPELVADIEVTGQPAFDRFAEEKTEEISNEARKELGIGQAEKFITFMGSMEKMELIKRFAEELAKVKQDFKFTFRIHPRDNTPLEDYEKLFAEMGLDYIRTMQLPTDRIGAASDLVINTESTEGMNAIYRRKPNISIVDPRFVDMERQIAPPSIGLKATVGLDKIENLSEAVEKLLSPGGKENKSLRQNMEKYYPKDGKNAERVLKVVKKILSEKK